MTMNVQKGISKFYRFDFDKGVPVTGFNGDIMSYRWRGGLKTIRAYGLQDAVEKFAMPVYRKFGTAAKLNVISTWVSVDGKGWSEIDTKSIHFAAYLVGCCERMKKEQCGYQEAKRK